MEHEQPESLFFSSEPTSHPQTTTTVSAGNEVEENSLIIRTLNAMELDNRVDKDVDKFIRNELLPYLSDAIDNPEEWHQQSITTKSEQLLEALQRLQEKTGMLLALSNLKPDITKFRENSKASASHPFLILMMIHQQLYGDDPKDFLELQPNYTGLDYDSNGSVSAVSPIKRDQEKQKHPISFSDVQWKTLPRILKDELHRTRYHYNKDFAENQIITNLQAAF